MTYEPMSVIMKLCGDDRYMIDELKREKYLNDIRPFFDEDLIKVIMGIRRCGKSILLQQIKEELLKYNDENHIIYLNFEDVENDFIVNYKDLNNYVKEKMIDEKKYYILLDEIQHVIEWEKTVNSLKAIKNVSIFITGSNSKMLSSDISDLLSGRYVKFYVQPFTFKEVCKIKNVTDYKTAFNDYVKWGGMPQRFRFDNEQNVRTYLTDVYDSIILKDIIKHYKITDIDLFNRIVEYIMTTLSQTFSPDSLADYLKKKEDRNVSKETIYNYLEYMCGGLLVNKVDCYDVRGKRILNGKYKYYLTDLGLGRIKNILKKEQLGAYLENIVYNELIYRGYDIKVGTLDNGEIDFVAEKNGIKEYYQVCYLIGDNDKVHDREFGAYNNIKDNYLKYVISMDDFDLSGNGIIHKNIIDWLLS